MSLDNFITDRELIEKLTLEMTKIESDGWETKYVRNSDNTEWTKMYLGSEYHGGGNPILFKLPKPSQSELINILGETRDLKQISAIACLLKETEEFDEGTTEKEFREELINLLEKTISAEDFKFSDYEKQRFTTIIYDSGLDQSHNQREMIGKRPEEVDKDYQHFKGIAERAKRIITIANNGYN